jgi:PAS domain S-box-containing protein
MTSPARTRQDIEQLSRAAIDALDEGVVLQDRDGVILASNAAAHRILGLTADELAGHAPVDPGWRVEYEGGSPFSLKAYPAMLALTTGEPQRGAAVKVTRGDGSEVWALVNSQPLVRDGESEPYGVVTSFSDITERRRAEEALGRERDHAAALVGALQSGLVETDADGVVREVNARFCAMTGFAHDELLGVRPPYPWWPEEDAEVLAAGRRALVAQSGEWQVTFCRKSGEPFPALVSIAHQTGDDAGLVSTVHDLTEWVAAREELEESERRFHAAFEQAPVGKALVSLEPGSEGRFIEVNQALCDLVGRSPDELVGATFEEITFPSDLESSRALLARMLSGELASVQAEKRYVHADGHVIWALLSASLVRDSEGRPLYSVGQTVDITELKRAEEALRRSELERHQLEARREKAELEAQLLQSQRLDSLGRLAGGIAHDFNNLLGIIINHAAFAARQLETDSPLHGDVAGIRKAADRAADLTHQLLLIGRREVARPEVFDLNDLVGEVAVLLRRSLGSRIELAVTPSAHPCHVEADRGQIEQVLVNLVLNGRDAMADGGRLTIETLAPDSGPVHYVGLSVADTGTGMTPEVVERAFEPFFTTKPPDQGSGLGLATVYGIVERAGGRVWIDTRIGAGTVVTALLPAVSAPPSPTSDEAGVAPPSAGGETVLLVEDDADVRSMTHRILVEGGYEVVEAMNGAHALAVLETLPTPPDLVVSDVVMPEMSGRELLEHLRASGSDLPVILVSGYARDAFTSGGRADESFVLVEKPFTEEQLLREVRAVLDGALTS